MATLDKRIAALEQAKPAAIGPFFIHFVGLGAEDCEFDRITKGDHVWHRQPGETDEELKERAQRETPPPKDGCSTVFMCW